MTLESIRENVKEQAKSEYVQCFVVFLANNDCLVADDQFSLPLSFFPLPSSLNAQQTKEAVASTLWLQKEKGRGSQEDGWFVQPLSLSVPLTHPQPLSARCADERIHSTFLWPFFFCFPFPTTPHPQHTCSHLNSGSNLDCACARAQTHRAHVQGEGGRNDGAGDGRGVTAARYGEEKRTS